MRQTDPTRTLTLRKRLRGKMRKRWRKLRGEIRRQIRDMHDPPDPNDISRFMDWYERRVGQIFNLPPGDQNLPDFLQEPIRQVYERGVESAHSESESQIDVPYEAGGMLAIPAIRDRLVNLIRRTRSDLDGIISATRQQVHRALTEQIEADRSQRVIIDSVLERVDAVGETRSVALAETQIVRSHNKAKVGVFDTLDAEAVRVTAEVRVETAGDDRVCIVCEELSDRGYIPIDEAENLLPVHPRCRCELSSPRFRNDNNRGDS